MWSSLKIKQNNMYFELSEEARITVRIVKLPESFKKPRSLLGLQPTRVRADDKHGTNVLEIFQL
jgi:hypothetical protein